MGGEETNPFSDGMAAAVVVVAPLLSSSLRLLDRRVRAMVVGEASDQKKEKRKQEKREKRGVKRGTWKIKTMGRQVFLQYDHACNVIQKSQAGSAVLLPRRSILSEFQCLVAFAIGPACRT